MDTCNLLGLLLTCLEVENEGMAMGGWWNRLKVSEFADKSRVCRCVQALPIAAVLSQTSPPSTRGKDRVKTDCLWLPGSLVSVRLRDKKLRVWSLGYVVCWGVWRRAMGLFPVPWVMLVECNSWGEQEQNKLSLGQKRGAWALSVQLLSNRPALGRGGQSHQLEP